MLCSLFRPSRGWREAPVCLSMVTLHPTDIFETFSESLNIVTDCWTIRRSYTISLLRLGQPGRSHEGVGQKKLLEILNRHIGTLPVTASLTTCHSLRGPLLWRGANLCSVGWCCDAAILDRYVVLRYGVVPVFACKVCR